jgi:17beta-estradiol 17-dehydrogenase / very-long-chain 3-oxoacyl-CoA reductase
LSKFGAKKGAWAVVTGSTDGIGKEFARQLGKGGFNVLLVARNAELLNATAQEIGAWFKQRHARGQAETRVESRYSVKAQTHVIDFAKANAEKYAELSSVLQQLDIGVLGERYGLCIGGRHLTWFACS